MLLTAQDRFDDKKIIKTIGLVKGGFSATFKSFSGGGAVAPYTELCRKTMEQAQEELIQEAQKMGANAIVAVRFEKSNMLQDLIEVTAYGTAVIIE